MLTRVRGGNSGYIETTEFLEGLPRQDRENILIFLNSLLGYCQKQELDQSIMEAFNIGPLHFALIAEETTLNQATSYMISLTILPTREDEVVYSERVKYDIEEEIVKNGVPGFVCEYCNSFEIHLKPTKGRTLRVPRQYGDNMTLEDYENWREGLSRQRRLNNYSIIYKFEIPLNPNSQTILNLMS